MLKEARTEVLCEARSVRRQHGSVGHAGRARRDRAGGRGGRLRIDVGGGARRAARPAGAAVADGPAGSGSRPAARAHVGGRAHVDGAPRDRHRHPPAAQTRSCWRRRSRASTCSAAAASRSVSASATSNPSSAIGADFENRGAVTDEYLDAMQHLWYDEHPEFHGRFADFAGVDAYPRPGAAADPDRDRRAHEPRLPARGRARPRLVRLRDEARRRRRESRGPARRRGRDRATGRARPARDHRDAARAPHPEVAATFAELGVDRLVPFPPPTRDGITATIDAAVDAVENL